MALFTMAVEVNEMDCALNCLTPELVALTTYKVVKQYWENVGLTPTIDLYAEFDTVVS